MDNPNPLMNSQDLLDFFDLYDSNTLQLFAFLLHLLLLSISLINATAVQST